MHTQVSLSSIGQLIDGTLENPAGILGPHVVDYGDRTATAIRSFLPEAQAAWVIDNATGVRRPMRRLHPAGFFEAICDAPVDAAPNKAKIVRIKKDSETFDAKSRYRIQMSKKSGEVVDMQDPYAAPSILSDFDRYLIGEGRHHQLYDRMGAHQRVVDEQSGVNFAVWAPNARTVQVVGDFNGWDGREHTARVHPHLGIWELFIPGAKAG